MKLLGSTSASNMDLVESRETSALKRNSNDIAWEYGELRNANNLDKVKCKLCGKEFSGGAYRIKEHIGRILGNVSACPNSSKKDQQKCRNALEHAKKKRKNKLISDVELRKSVRICNGGDDEIDDEIEEMRSKKKPRTLGPMDRFASDMNPRPSSLPISEALRKERLHKVHQYVSRWVYVSGVAFNATGIDEFNLMLEAAGQFGPGVTPPSQYQLREPLLKEEVDRVKGLLKTQEEEWKENGCSIMTDAWSDSNGKRTSIVNLWINCRGGGTVFRSSKECSDEAHRAEFIKGCIEDVGVENVVQVVTDNAPNNMAAAEILKEEIPSIFWTSCAAHTVNLMLESIVKLHNFKMVIDRAKRFTIFIYAHRKTLAMTRKFTKKKDIVRPGVIRFATCFLTLQSLMEKKDNLRAMFVSSDWENCKWSKHHKGEAAYKTMTSMDFWNGVTMCLEVFGPLVKILRMVDGDKKPTMGFLHGELIQAKKEVRFALNNVEENIQPIMSIIHQRIEGRLDNPLHLAGYLLNPYYFYKDPTTPLKDDVVTSFFKCVEAFFPNDVITQCNIINSEINKYKKKEGNFGTLWAIKGCEETNDDYDPVEWWNTYGTSVPNLQRMAKRILSLTTSSSGCERNYSSFEGTHTKKRNRLDTGRLNNLVYVQFNARLMNKRKKQKEKNIDILLADHATYAQEWIVECEEGNDVKLGHSEGETPANVRELDDGNFSSDDEDEELLDVDFESDEDQVVEKKKMMVV